MSLFLTNEQNETLENYLLKYKDAVENRNKSNDDKVNDDKINDDNISVDDMKNLNLSAEQLDNPLPYFSDDENDKNLTYFSTNISERAHTLRSLALWANRAMRAAKILRQSILKKKGLSTEKQKTLLSELKPPKSSDTENIPNITLNQLSDDNIVKKYVTELKKHRFIWRKSLSNQQRRLRSGLEYEQSLLLNIGKLSISCVIPLLKDHLQQNYVGAEQKNVVIKDKYQLLNNIISSTISPSRGYLYSEFWALYIKYIESDPKILDVITITPTSKSCTLFDFRAYLLYKESFSKIPTCISLINNCILYIKKRLIPNSTKWDYIPKGVIPKLLLLHRDWITYAGFDINSKDIWISSIEIHIYCKEFEIVKKLLTIVQQLPIIGLKDIYKLANNSEFKEIYPKFKISPTISSTLLTRIKHRTKFYKQDQYFQVQSEEQLRKYFTIWRQEISYFIEQDKRLDIEIKQQMFELGIDPLCFIYFEAIIRFGKFANRMEFAIEFLKLYIQRILYLLSQNTIPENFKLSLISRLKNILLRLRDFSVFPNVNTIQEEIIKLSLLVTKHIGNYIKSKEVFVGFISTILESSFSVLSCSSYILLVYKMTEFITMESCIHLHIIRSIFQTLSDSLFKQLSDISLKDSIVSQLCKLYITWCDTETILSQYKQVMIYYEFALKHPQLNSQLDIWLNYISFCLKRKKYDNVRSIFCRALIHVRECYLKDIWIKFLQFERNEGNNKDITLRILFSLAQHKIGDKYKLKSDICKEIESNMINNNKIIENITILSHNKEDKDKNDIIKQTNTDIDNDNNDDDFDLCNISFADSPRVSPIILENSSPIPSPVDSPISLSPASSPIPSPPPLDNIDDLLKVQQPIIGKKRKYNGTNKQVTKKRKTKNTEINHNIKSKQHNTTIELNETLVEALVNPSIQQETSLLALEKIQKELLRNKKLQNIKKQPISHNLNINNNITQESILSQEQLNSINKKPTIQKNTIVLLDEVQPNIPYNYNNVNNNINTNAPPSSSSQYNISIESIINNPINYNTIPIPNIQQTPQQSNVLQVDWTQVLQDETVLAIVKQLYELQTLAEIDIEERRKRLQKHQKEQENKVIAENKQRLNRVRTPTEYTACKSKNMMQLENLKQFFAKQNRDFEIQVQQERNKAITDQQLTMQSAQIPGFFPTQDPKYIAVQVQILSLLFELAKRKSSQR